MKNFDLSGKVAIVTGSSNGIGEDIAQKMGKAGAKVIISSRKADSIAAVVDKFTKQGIEAYPIVCNMGNTEQIDQLVEKTMEVFGGIDIIVNNAMSNPIFGPVIQADLAAFDKIMQVNVRGPLYFSQKVYPVFKARGGGNILNISSVAGITPDAGLGVYSISKAALIMQTKTLAKEWGKDKIRVNAICPGVIRTPIVEKTLLNYGGGENQLTQRQAIRRIGEVEEISHLALLLTSEAGNYFTGAVVTVDGGLTI